MSRPINEAGYLAAYAIAEDNLRIGRTVVADSVNALAVIRDAWIAVARDAQVRAVEIEVVCSDAAEHRRRVETRVSGVPGLRLPTWKDMLSREYHVWEREHFVIDTAGCSVEQNVEAIRMLLDSPTAKAESLHP